MSEQDEANLLRWLGRGGFTEGDPLATVRRIIAERDAARAAQGEQHLELTRAADTIAAMQGANATAVKLANMVKRSTSVSYAMCDLADAILKGTP